MATHGGVVEDIVVDQRGRVDHLDDGAEDGMGGHDLAAGAGGKQEQHGAKTFAAIMADMVDDAGHGGEAALDRPRQHALHLFEIGGDRGVQVRGGNGHGLGRQDGWIHCAPTQKARPGRPASTRGFRRFKSL